ncbi:cadherin-related family member 4 isoform X8 [Patagioenas fasciata]|uniref:cadherin-related family member 4 isoform X8 n=1 Tax=Patagioenas fasciata TaxID=372321 RepID=UPI003A99F463
MGMHRHLIFLLLLFLLLLLYAPGTFVRATDLPDLPRVVALSEDVAPGTLVAKVNVSCSNTSSSPNVTLHGIDPGHPFNPIAVSADPVATTTFWAEVTLRAGAQLDAHQVNQYTLTLWAACPGEEEVEKQLFVRVTADQALRCDTPFASVVTGEIRSTRRLEVAHTHLIVQAYNALHPTDHATATLNITVQGTDQRAPSCVPAIVVYGLGWGAGCGSAPPCPGQRGQKLSRWPPRRRSQVPETMSPGSTLVTLRCTGAEGNLRYALEGPPASRSRFRMDGPQLQVNTTLDYDSEATDTMGFQFTATIVVMVGGQPSQSTRVPMLVTVTPVNEFTPVCPNGATFTVMETAAFGSTVGRVTGTDRDYPRDSLEYSLEAGPGPAQPFSVDTHGEIRVVGPLDSQRHKSYRLTVRLTDTHNDLDPANRRSCLCDVTVRLQAVPAQVPVCTPEVQELRIMAGLGGHQPVTRVVCQASPNGATLAYAITGGNEDGHFRLEGNTLFYLPGDLAEPHTFMLLVEVWGGPSGPRHSTVVALVVHVTPQSTAVPPSTTPLHTTLQKEPLVITRTEAVWHPVAWFVAVLTISGALLLATLGCAARNLLCSNRDPGKLLLSKSSWDVEEQRGSEEEQGHPQANSMVSVCHNSEGGCPAKAWVGTLGHSAPALTSPLHRGSLMAVRRTHALEGTISSTA